MKIALYMAVIFVCTIFNSASQVLACSTLRLSLKYNIPISAMIQADNNPVTSLEYLTLKQLGEVRVS